MARHLDDAGQVSGYADQGALVVKGEAHITGPGLVQLGDRELRGEHLILATGAVANIPPIEGLDQITTWTNRETYTTKELPGRAVLVGGSAVGVETGLFLSHFGVEVTIVQRSDRLLDREEPRVSELVAEPQRRARRDPHQHQPPPGPPGRLRQHPGAGRRHGGRSRRRHPRYGPLTTHRRPRSRPGRSVPRRPGRDHRRRPLQSGRPGCGRSATSPASCPSPMSPSTGPHRRRHHPWQIT